MEYFSLKSDQVMRAKEIYSSVMCLLCLGKKYLMEVAPHKHIATQLTACFPEMLTHDIKSPRYICGECFQLLEITYKFRKRGNETAFKLRSYILDGGKRPASDEISVEFDTDEYEPTCISSKNNTEEIAKNIDTRSYTGGRSTTSRYENKQKYGSKVIAPQGTDEYDPTNWRMDGAPRRTDKEYQPATFSNNTQVGLKRRITSSTCENISKKRKDVQDETNEEILSNVECRQSKHRNMEIEIKKKLTIEQQFRDENFNNIEQSQSLRKTNKAIKRTQSTGRAKLKQQVCDLFGSDSETELDETHNRAKIKGTPSTGRINQGKRQMRFEGLFGSDSETDIV